MQAVVDQVRAAEGRLEAWFGSVMDRVSQRFATKMRITTIALAVVIAFTIDLDSIHLVGRLAANETLRAGLVAAVEPMLATAASTLEGGPPQSAAGTALHVEALRRTVSARGLSAPVPSTIATQSEAEQWLGGQAPDEAARRDLIAAYRARLREVADEFGRRIAGRISDIRQTLAIADLDVIPPPSRAWPWKTGPISSACSSPAPCSAWALRSGSTR